MPVLASGVGVVRWFKAPYLAPGGHFVPGIHTLFFTVRKRRRWCYRCSPRVVLLLLALSDATAARIGWCYCCSPWVTHPHPGLAQHSSQAQDLFLACREWSTIHSLAGRWWGHEGPPR